MSVNGFGETPEEEKARYDYHREMGDKARYEFNQQGGNNGGGSSCVTILFVISSALGSLSYCLYSLVA